ncbi:hypothetical protein DL764_000372 [Monosporascus ibericus]|uniref:F-box domain-containing protein n=1 Tax=Monosporascus ibericus TaxID=155417 RepID=A0A4Q4TTU7_9PEZI|nr:hypothetical protein DL764_000372 [Monosporascus ibericus]
MDPRGVEQQHTRARSDNHEVETKTTTTLLDLLSNTVLLRQTLPYLPVSSLLNLAAASRAFRDLVHETPGAFRHLDLTRVRAAQFDNPDGPVDRGGEVWRNVQVDENLSEDDFYSGPLRGIFQSLRSRRGGDVLRDVRTLVLDGLSVTAELVNDILVDPGFRVRVLSIREVRNLNEQKLMQSLRYACRPTRPEGTPRLHALYVFGKKDAPVPSPSSRGSAGGGATAGASVGAGWNHRSQHALKESMRAEGDDWYHKRGRVLGRAVGDRWAETLLDCRGVIRFDAVLCTAPCHQNSPAFGRVPGGDGGSGAARSPWAVASFAVGGCASCGSAPEGFTVYGESPAETLPLLLPVPLHSSTLRSATCPRAVGSEGGDGEGGEGRGARFVPRCLECIRERYCFSCDQWWCEACYQVPSREELAAAGAQHVHIVADDDAGGANGLIVHELAAFEQPKVKTRKITRSCWECDLNSNRNLESSVLTYAIKCETCIADTQKICKACGGGYCIVHYDGSTETLCDCMDIPRLRPTLPVAY